MASQVPPDSRSRPASTLCPCGSCHQSMAAVGRRKNSSRLAAMTSGKRGFWPMVKAIRHMIQAFPLVREAAEAGNYARSEEHTSELQSRPHLVCRLLLEKKK